MVCIVTDPPNACPACTATPRFIRVTIVDNEDTYSGVYWFEWAGYTEPVSNPPQMSPGYCQWLIVEPPAGIGASSSIAIFDGTQASIGLDDPTLQSIDDAELGVMAINCGDALVDVLGLDERLTFTLETDVGSPPTQEGQDMAYCTQSDIEQIFGVRNVATWSNLDNSSTSADGPRINAAIEYARTWLDDRFAGGRYQLPLTTDGSNVPSTIRDLAARLAGVWLYESRGMDEQDENGRPFNRLAFHRRYVERQVLRFISERDLLNAVRRQGAAGQSSVPQINEQADA